jgi:hypothetical protein
MILAGTVILAEEDQDSPRYNDLAGTLILAGNMILAQKYQDSPRYNDLVGTVILAHQDQDARCNDLADVCAEVG